MNMNDTQLVKKAKIFAAKKHKDQKRKITGLPYITHPETVRWFVRLLKPSKNSHILEASAYLHDVVEDCGVTIEEVELEFGKEVAQIVLELTNDKTIKGETEKIAYLSCKLLMMSNYALAIKLCDILHNLSDCGDEESEFKTRFFRKANIIISNVKRFRQLTPSQLRIMTEIDKLL